MTHDAYPPCPLCEFPTQTYLFTRQGGRVSRCTQCGLTRLDGAGTPAAAEAPRPPWSSTEKKAAEGYLSAYRDRGGACSRMLLIGDEDHPVIGAAQRGGFAIAARQSMHEIE